MNGFGNLTRNGSRGDNCKNYDFFPTGSDNPEYVSNFTIYYTNKTIVKVYFETKRRDIYIRNIQNITVGNSVPGM